MTCGPERRHGGCRPAARRGVRTLALALLACAAGRAACAEAELEAFLQARARISADEVRFVERTFVSMADQPLKSSGVLRYTAPDRLEKRTERPRRQSLRIEGARLVMETGDPPRVRSLGVTEAPGVAALVTGLRAALAGDGAMLQATHHVHWQAEGARWNLVLRPREDAAARMVRSVQLSGRGDVVTRVEVVLAGGDRSVMLLGPDAR